MKAGPLLVLLPLFNSTKCSCRPLKEKKCTCRRNISETFLGRIYILRLFNVFRFLFPRMNEIFSGFVMYLIFFFFNKAPAFVGEAPASVHVNPDFSVQGTRVWGLPQGQKEENHLPGLLAELIAHRGRQTTVGRKQGGSLCFQKCFPLSAFPFVLKSRHLLACKVELWQPCKDVSKLIKPREVI